MELQNILIIYIIGVSVLLTAIVVNSLANKLKILTWYEFIKNKPKLNIVSFLFLFIIYPLLLGLAAYFVLKLFT